MKILPDHSIENIPLQFYIKLPLGNFVWSKLVSQTSGNNNGYREPNFGCNIAVSNFVNKHKHKHQCVSSKLNQHAVIPMCKSQGLQSSRQTAEKIFHSMYLSAHSKGLTDPLYCRLQSSFSSVSAFPPQYLLVNKLHSIAL